MDGKWQFPQSQSQLKAARFLASQWPEKYDLHENHYLESMCIHVTLRERSTGEVLMPETVETYFGRPAPVEGARIDMQELM